MINYFKSLIENSKAHKLIIFIVSVLVFINTINHDFVLDDNIVLKKNEFVKKGFAGIWDILSNDTFKGFFLNDQSGVSVTGGRYRPLTLVWFAALYPMFGLNPMFYHLINILLFAGLCVIFYHVVNKLLRKKLEATAAPISLIAAIIFAIHPIHTEVVCNVKGIDEISSLFFAILTMNSTINYINSKKLLDVILIFVFFSLSIFSKESAISFMLLIPIALILLHSINFKEVIKISLPLLLAFGFYSAVRFSVIGIEKFSDVSRDVLTNPFLRIRGTSITEASLSERLGMIFYCIGRYFQLMIFPHPLTHDYFPLHIKIQPVSNPVSILTLFSIFVLSILAFIKRKVNPLLTYSWIAIIVPILLISNLVVPMGTPMGERFAFIASIGFSIFVGYFLYRIINNNPKWGFLLFSLVFVLFSFKTVERNMDWKNEYSLFSTDVKTSAQSIKAHSELAYHLVDKIRNSKDSTQIRLWIDEALPHLEKTYQLYPRHANAIFLTGNLHYMNKNYDKAITAYEKYLDLVPSGKEVMKNLQVCYREYGRELAFKNQDIDKSIDLLIKSLKLNPNDPRLLESLGVAYGNQKSYDLAIDYFNKAIKLDPTNGMMLINLSNVYYSMGDKKMASEYVKQAYKLDAELGPKLINMQNPSINK